MVVASQVEGRVRIRDEGLKRALVAGEVRDALLESEGVTGVESNPRVGSLLVLYNAAVTAVEHILKKVSELLGTEEEQTEERAEGEEAPRSFPGVRLIERLSQSMPRSISRRWKRNLVNAGMLLSLAVSLLLGFFGLKKLHILTGILFVALFGDHFYLHKERIFT